MIISILKSALKPPVVPEAGHPAIVWKPSGIDKMFIPDKSFKSKQKLAALKTIKSDLPIDLFQSVKDEDFANELYRLERSQKVKQYKFGVLYVHEGQTDEDEMFANCN